MKNTLQKMGVICVILASLFISGCSRQAEKVYGTWYEEHGYLKLEVNQDNLVLHDFVYSIDDPVVATFDYQVTSKNLTIIGNDGEKVTLTLTYDDNKDVAEMHYTIEDKEIVLTRDEVDLVPLGENLIKVLTWLKQASEGNTPRLSVEEQALLVDAQTMLTAYNVINPMIKSLSFEWTGNRK